MKEQKEQRLTEREIHSEFGLVTKKSLSQTQQLAASKEQKIVANDNFRKKEEPVKTKLTAAKQLQIQEDQLQMERENFLLMDHAYQEALDKMQKDTKSEYSAKGRRFTAFGPYYKNNTPELEAALKAKDLQLQQSVFGEGGRNAAFERLQQEEKIQADREAVFQQRLEEHRKKIDGKAKSEFNRLKQKPLKIEYRPAIEEQKKLGAEQLFNRKLERENHKLKEEKWKQEEPQRMQEAEKQKLQQKQERINRKDELIKQGNATQERIKHNSAQNKLKKKQQTKERINDLVQEQKKFDQKQAFDQMAQNKRLQSEQKILNYYKPNELKQRLESLHQKVERNNTLWGRFSGKYTKLQQQENNLRLTQKDMNEKMAIERAKTEKEIDGLKQEHHFSKSHPESIKTSTEIENGSKESSKKNNYNTRMAARIKSSFARSKSRDRGF